MTDLEAANRALVLLGVAPIGSLNDQNQAARTMNGLLANTKRAVLNEFPFTFALRIVPLSGRGGSVAGYAHTFAFPSDALNVQRVYGDDVFRGVAEFRVVNGVIAANVSGGSVEYIADVQDLSSWPQPMRECLVTRLAADAAATLGGSQEVAAGLLQKYRVLAAEAAQVSVNEESVPPLRGADHHSRSYVSARR